MRAAVFLDRDGTVIEHVHHLTQAEDVRLLPGTAEAIRRFQSLGYACVIVTNQSVIGRGLLTIHGLELVHEEMHRQLRAQGVRLDGVYYCPAAPVSSDCQTVDDPERKPGPGMLLRAARELRLDMTRSWMIGDMESDMLAGRNANCRGTILVRTGKGATVNGNEAAIDYVVDDLLQAAQLIADKHGSGELSGPGCRSYEQGTNS